MDPRVYKLVGNPVLKGYRVTSFRHLVQVPLIFMSFEKVRAPFVEAITFIHKLILHISLIGGLVA